MKKIIVLALAAALAASVLAGCSGNSGSSSSASSSSASQEPASSETSSSSQEEAAQLPDVDLVQAKAPVSGATLAEIKTNLGTIKVQLFPDKTPKSVENFVGLAQQGYYNGLTFHRIIQEFVIQGGDPEGNGTGGKSLWGGRFSDEINPDLWHFTGTLAYANGGPNTNGSQFYIVDGAPVDEDSLAAFQLAGMPQNVIDYYREVGGCPNLDFARPGTNFGQFGIDVNRAGQYTIFGQVYEGMDVVKKLAALPTDANDKPTEAATIETITITTMP